MEIFSERLLSYREKSGISLVELSKKLGISRQTLDNYIKGKQAAGIDTVLKLCEIFNVEPNDLLWNRETEKTVSNYLGEKEIEINNILEKIEDEEIKKTFRDLIRDNRQLSKKVAKFAEYAKAIYDLKPF